jgi:hypothetical protein
MELRERTTAEAVAKLATLLAQACQRYRRVRRSELPKSDGRGTVNGELDKAGHARPGRRGCGWRGGIQPVAGVQAGSSQSNWAIGGRSVFIPNCPNDSQIQERPISILKGLMVSRAGLEPATT